jgi:CelD/BcsL family acetyltransferase involved in cellulose biosynthesis
MENRHLSAEAFIDRRSMSRLHPSPVRAMAAGDSTILSSPWKTWADADAMRRWDELARTTSTPNPFFESWYLLPALRQFDPQGRVEILRMERGGKLVGLMPMAHPWRYGRWPFPHLAIWLHPNCFLGAPLVAAGEEAAFWCALFAWADAHAGPALFLHMPTMPLGGPLADALFARGEQEGRRVAVVQREERALLSSALSPDDYLQQAVPGKKRKEYRRQHARLSEQGRLEFSRQDSTTGLAVWIDHFLALEAQGWKGRAGSALACADQTELLFRDSLNEAGKRGLLERLTLSLDGRPIAMLATFLTAPGAFSYKTTFDERYSRFSPGVLLQLENLSLLQRDGIDWCDSCAAADHPMIDSLWMERRRVGRLSIAIGGVARRAAFDRLVDLELARNPTGTQP